jgi:hypothetical protein
MAEVTVIHSVTTRATGSTAMVIRALRVRGTGGGGEDEGDGGDRLVVRLPILVKFMAILMEKWDYCSKERHGDCRLEFVVEIERVNFSG